jgi:hypothetical protein
MPRYAIGLAVAAALTLSAVVAGAGEDKGVEEAHQEIFANAAARKGKPLTLDSFMEAYKRKDKGGIGYGEKPKPESGIEARILQLLRGNKGPSKETLQKEKKALIKLAHVNVAMAEIGRPHYDAYKATGKANGKTKKDWDRWFDEQKKAAKELIEAVNKADGKAVAEAAKDLLNTCTECHASFRQ